MDQVKIFKGYLRQILLGPFLDTLSHILIKKKTPERVEAAVRRCS